MYKIVLTDEVGTNTVAFTASGNEGGEASKKSLKRRVEQ